MTIDNLKNSLNHDSFGNSKKIKFVCPICKTKKSLEFPKSIVNKNSGLSTISIHRGLVCNHAFQAFIDKNYMIRGYQKVDFELKSESEKSQNEIQQVRKDNELFSQLFLEGNYVEYIPEKPQISYRSEKNYSKKDINNRKVRKKINNKDNTKEMQQRTLKQIYEDFWEFIKDDNNTFQKFIIRDERRQNLAIY